MTIRELIELLEGLPPELRVETEGCDCIGIAGGVDVSDDDGTVLITRVSRRPERRRERKAQS